MHHLLVIVSNYIKSTIKFHHVINRFILLPHEIFFQKEFQYIWIYMLLWNQKLQTTPVLSYLALYTEQWILLYSNDTFLSVCFEETDTRLLPLVVAMRKLICAFSVIMALSRRRCQLVAPSPAGTQELGNLQPAENIHVRNSLSRPLGIACVLRGFAEG